MRAGRFLPSITLLLLLASAAALLLWLPGRRERLPAGPAAEAQRPDLPLAAGGTPDAAGAEGWSSIGGPGTGLGEFNQPRGITGLPDGSFVVVDRSARVQRFDAAGRALGLWVMPERALGNPKGLCALPGGKLLVCDTHYGRVVVMSLAGQVLQTWGEPGTAPGQFVHPLSCAVDERAGAAYVVEYGAYNDRVQKFRLDGTLLKSWGTFGAEPGQFRRPSGVALDRAGNCYIADACNHRVQKFDGEGRLLAVFGELGSRPGQLRYPSDIALDAAGRVYVAEFSNHRVSVFDAEGHFLEELGGPGFDVGQFNQPWSLTVDARGRLLVSDTRNHRVQARKVASGK